MTDTLDSWKPYKTTHPDFKYSDDETKQDMTLSEYWFPQHMGNATVFGGGSFPTHNTVTAEITSAYDSDKINIPSETYYRSVTSMVKEFTHKSVGTDLWIDLIWEEVQELFEAYDQYTSDVSIDAATDLTDRINLLKEMADLVYVVHGLANELNWDLDEAIQRVHKSNMSKLDDNGQPIYREDGKRMKSKNYKPPYLDDLVK